MLRNKNLELNQEDDLNPCSCNPLERILTLLKNSDGQPDISAETEYKNTPKEKIIDELAEAFQALIVQIDSAVAVGKPPPCTHPGVIHQVRQVLTKAQHPVIRWEQEKAKERAI